MEVNEGAQDGNGDENGDGSGDGAGTGTGTGVGTRRRRPDGNGDNDNGNENRIGNGEERRKSARNRKIVDDAVRETGETRVDRGENVEKKGMVQQLPTQII